jgi:SNF2 family DNA or RNA helicase
MIYKGKAIEVIGEKEVFGKIIAWIRVLEDNFFLQVPREDLEQDLPFISMAYLRFVSIAAKIKNEIAQKKILAPYESSLLPLPHQILVLEKVMQSNQNRFLLADEVGMGKTIETGLILKELKLRGEIKRILAIVPKSSMLQWQSEMKEHFNEVFHLYDSVMINHMTQMFSNINADEEYNFWIHHNQVIVSTDALKPLEKRQGWTKERIDEYNRYRLEAVLEADYDLIIIDEAHKMGGSTALVSRYILAQQLCNIVPNVLLLTATPHRGKPDHFRRILQLLEPDAFAGEGLPKIKDLEPYVIRTEKRLAVDYEGNKLFNERFTHRFDVALDLVKHHKQIDLYESVTDYVRKGFNTARQQKNTATGLIMVLFQRLVSSSTAAILSAMQGRLERLLNGEEDLPENFADEMDVISDEPEENIDFDKLYQHNISGLVNEVEILEELIIKAKDCVETETDAKAEALMHRFSELQQKEVDYNLKIIVFTEFRTTQRMLKNFFEDKGYACVDINGGQEIDERKRALTQFKNDAQILIATDAAGESLNMQFCHVVFNYDLPWNPMMIEQRIGRVDRIGQKENVMAFNMLTNNSVDQRVYEVIVDKLNNILDQLGIDKTSDVLDSTIEMKDINQLYLRSLLDPQHFRFAEESWLHTIKEKLRNFKATEGIFPEVKESEIDHKKAAVIKHSPLPQWLEDLVKKSCKD